MQGPKTRMSFLASLNNQASHEAWAEFAAIYRPLIIRVARVKGLQDADAEDLAQDVMARVEKAVASCVPSGEGSFSSMAVPDHQKSCRLCSLRSAYGLTPRAQAFIPKLSHFEWYNKWGIATVSRLNSTLRSYNVPTRLTAANWNLALACFNESWGQNRVTCPDWFEK